MKTIYTVAFVLFISVSLSFTSKTTLPEQENTLMATFKGMTEDDYYKFEDGDKKEVLFYDIHEEIEISLYDAVFIGKKFSITWTEKEIELMDEEGELTGEKKKVKSITKLKLIE